MNAWSPLRGRGAFHQLRRDGRKLQCESVQCWYRVKPSDRPQVTAGFAIGGRAFSAVQRNRMRRQMKEAFRLELDGLRDSIQDDHTSILFTLRTSGDRPIPRIRYDGLQRDIANLCRAIAFKQ